jgi:4'-phosphopantetheinyl transferase
MAWQLSPPVVTWFRLTATMTAPDVATARAVLSAEERARCDRFRFERDRRDFAAAHALLRGALAFHGGRPAGSWRFEADAAGKPFLVGHPGIEFSIAHTRGLVACALSVAGLVGVDVEVLDEARDAEEIAERYFAEPEIRALRSCAPGVERQARFTELWTLKEAYVKALGSGLRQSLDEFGFECLGGSALRFIGPGGFPGTGWRFGLFAPSARHRLAVALRASLSLGFCVRRWPGEDDAPPLAPLRMSP